MSNFRISLNLSLAVAVAITLTKLDIFHRKKKPTALFVRDGSVCKDVLTPAVVFNYFPGLFATPGLQGSSVCCFVQRGCFDASQCGGFTGYSGSRHCDNVLYYQQVPMNHATVDGCGQGVNVTGHSSRLESGV